ncbi:hypothetical protein VTN00DRAFT_478 [Thermoascus crustaceus]|uniref:uncharacterized protein n=1 Tax=Thermoascus crustaceus TaxID=5088 RepID=UPI0037434B3E
MRESRAEKATKSAFVLFCFGVNWRIREYLTPFFIILIFPILCISIGKCSTLQLAYSVQPCVDASSCSALLCHWRDIVLKKRHIGSSCVIAAIFGWVRIWEDLGVIWVRKQKSNDQIKSNIRVHCDVILFYRACAVRSFNQVGVRFPFPEAVFHDYVYWNKVSSLVTLTVCLCKVLHQRYR